VWAAMAFLFLCGVTVAYWAEARGNPLLTAAGADQTATALSPGGNMEGKEVRFGIANTALFATITTDASCGAVNGWHDSFTPLGGLVPLANMQLSEVVFGGVQMAMLTVLIFSLLILTFTAMSSVSPGFGTSSIFNPGPHGLSEILYAYSSASANNGSAFGGISVNTKWYNTTLGLAMLFGRFFMIIPPLAIAGSLGRKKVIPPSLGTFPVTTPLFTALLVGVILIVGALTFFPALSLGPIVEHFLMTDGRVY
jgi:K+-transporting ATPase ATPase A chain